MPLRYFPCNNRNNGGGGIINSAVFDRPVTGYFNFDPEPQLTSLGMSIGDGDFASVCGHRVMMVCG